MLFMVILGGRGSEGLWFRIFGGDHSLALAGKLEDNTVMNQSVDGRHGGHGVVEDFVPFGEGQVGGDHERPALVFEESEATACR